MNIDKDTLLEVRKASDALYELTMGVADGRIGKAEAVEALERIAGGKL